MSEVTNPGDPKPLGEKCRWCGDQVYTYWTGQSRVDQMLRHHTTPGCLCSAKLDEFAMEAFRAFLRNGDVGSDEDTSRAAYDLAEAMVRERAKRRD
jgi:hypothetical protein